MKLVGFITTIALLLASQPAVFTQGPANRTPPDPGQIRTSVQSMRWLVEAPHASGGAQGPFSPSGSGPHGHLSQRQDAILLGIAGGALGGFLAIGGLCSAETGRGISSGVCAGPSIVIGMPIGAVAGGVIAGWLTK